MIEGLIITKNKILKDERGDFHNLSLWKEYKEVYFSRNNMNVLRGLHYQEGQKKQVSIISGKIIDFIVDLRKSSETFLNFNVFEFEEGDVISIPENCAHGFYAKTNSSIVYCMNEYFDIDKYFGINYKSFNLDIINPIISEKDNNLPFLSEVIKNL